MDGKLQNGVTRPHRESFCAPNVRGSTGGNISFTDHVNDQSRLTSNLRYKPPRNTIG